MQTSTVQSPSPPQGRTWRFPKILIEDQLAFAGLSWLGMLAFVGIVVTGVSFTRSIEISGWMMASSIVPWFAAFIGGYVLHTVLPIHIAHGRTRRDFAIEALIFLGIYATALAVLITVGYALEHLLSSAAGWSRGTPDGRLFSSYTEYGAIFIEYLFMMLVWTALGGFVGASIYRSASMGWFSLVPALGLLAVSGLTRAESGQPMGFVINRLDMFDSPTMLLTVVLSTFSVVAALILTWLTVRDIPLRNR